MPDSRRFLHPEAIKRISRLDLRAQHIVEGFLAGMHRSPYFGQSVEFLQHREYVPGDDLRHVDWQVWARQDRLYVKQFEEDTNMRVHLLVDVSNSMQYGRGTFNKYEYASTIASCLAYLVLKQQDAIGCMTFDSRVRARIPTRSKRNHLMTIVRSLDLNRPADKTELHDIFRVAAQTYPRRGMTVVISDLFGDPDSTLRGLRMLRQCGHDVLVFHVMDDDELDFPFSGPTRFEDLETDTRLNCNPQALREGYLEAVEEFLLDIKHGTASSSVDYQLIRTSDPVDAVLAHFLSRRIAFARKK